MPRGAAIAYAPTGPTPTVPGARWPSGLDWRSGGPGFEFRYCNFASELLAIQFTPLCQLVSFGGDTKTSKTI